MKPALSRGGHFAVVRMRLVLPGVSFSIAQMGRDFLFIESPSDHPPTRATIELQVDDSQRSWEVYLAEGIKEGEVRVHLLPVETAPEK